MNPRARSWSLICGLSFGSLGLVACATTTGARQAATTAQSGPTAVATLEPKSGSTLTGRATFSTGASGQVTLVLSLEGATPGVHAAHLHDTGDCSAPDAKSAGGHWNPTSAPHGRWGSDGHHLGDVGNVTVGADGKGTLTLTTDRWQVGGGQLNDVVGHSVIVHGGVDDFSTQPTGNAGNRAACGVIALQPSATGK